MSQNVELAKIKLKIKALSQKTVDQGCTEAEAELAFEKIGQLLEQYNLSIGEVDLSEEPCVEKIFNTNTLNKSPTYFAFSSLMNFCDVRGWISDGRRGRPGQWPPEKYFSYHMFGLESDAELAAYLCEVIERSIETETAKFKKTDGYKLASNRRAATSSFEYGMAIKIGYRLADMKAEADKRYKEKASAFKGNTGTSLMIVKKNIIDEQLEKMNMRFTKKSLSQGRSNTSAFSAGSQAGDKVNLGRPVGQNTSSTLLLS